MNRAPTVMIMPDKPEPSTDNNFLASHAALLLASYHQLTGRHLLPPAGDTQTQARALYEADFAVLSHGTEDDPIFNYANLTAQRLFAMDWDSFVQLPSRQSAEPASQQARAVLMEKVTRQGYVDDYCGTRISADGRRFTIRNAVIWNVLDEKGNYCGQAATFIP